AFYANALSTAGQRVWQIRYRHRTRTPVLREPGHLHNMNDDTTGSSCQMSYQLEVQNRILLRWDESPGQSQHGAAEYLTKSCSALLHHIAVKNRIVAGELSILPKK